MSETRRQYCLLTLAVGFLWTLLPCTRLHAGHWEITSIYDPMHVEPQGGSYTDGPLHGQTTVTSNGCGIDRSAVGGYEFTSESECNVNAGMAGEVYTSGLPYNGGHSLGVYTDCHATYCFTWEGPPSTSPGMSLYWEASGSGNVYTLARAVLSGTGTVEASGGGAHSAGAIGYDYTYWWPGGGAWLDFDSWTNGWTVQISWDAGASASPGGSPTPSYADYDSDSYPGGDAYQDGVAGWSLDPQWDFYTSDSGIPTFSVYSGGGCGAEGGVNFALGEIAHGWASGVSLAYGDHSFQATAYPHE